LDSSQHQHQHQLVMEQPGQHLQQQEEQQRHSSGAPTARQLDKLAWAVSKMVQGGASPPPLEWLQVRVDLRMGVVALRSS
jgi:hypothetical protein